MRIAFRLVFLVAVSCAVAACLQPEVTAPPLLSSAPGEQRVTLLHFSDYHSHAMPFFSEHAPDQAGLARAVAYAKSLRVRQPGTLILGGGDLLNLGTPAWSDKYYRTCTDWTMWNGLLSAMAFGNHDVDYGWEAFAACRSKLTYPIVSANLVGADGQSLFVENGKPYLVRQVGELRIGLFALAGPDFPALVKATNLPPAARFSDGLAEAQRLVSALRNDERVHAVVFIGHQSRDADFAMAQRVPGIDLILGTHSHYKGPLQLIPGTRTYFISPYQYLTYLSQVELRFAGGQLTGISGGLVKLDEKKPHDPELALQLAAMQADLVRDPLYSARFEKVGDAAVELDLSGIDTGESVLGNFVMDTLRQSQTAHVAFSTASSFRASIPSGPIRMEDYLTAVPYNNCLVVGEISGARVRQALACGAADVGKDTFAVTSGLRYDLRKTQAEAVQILSSPVASGQVFSALDDSKTYRVVTTDFMARAACYRDALPAPPVPGTPCATTTVSDVLLTHIKTRSPIAASLDGRVRSVE